MPALSSSSCSFSSSSSLSRSSTGSVRSPLPGRLPSLALMVAPVRCSLEPRLLDLAGGGLGQLLDEGDVLGHHEVLQLLGALALDVLVGERDALLEHDEGLDRLAEELVGHADHGGLLDALDVEQDALDLLGRHLLAAGLDDVVHSADEVQVALGVHLAVVARVQDLLPGDGSGLELPGGRLR